MTTGRSRKDVAIAAGVGLGLAASSRLQLLPAVFVLLVAATELKGAREIVRTWQAGPSPQNFTLFTRDAVRTPLP